MLSAFAGADARVHAHIRMRERESVCAAHIRMLERERERAARTAACPVQHGCVPPHFHPAGAIRPLQDMCAMYRHRAWVTKKSSEQQ